MISDVFWLNDSTYCDEFGGKAKNLCEMKKLGFPVPDGFVITKNEFNDETRKEIVEDFEKLMKKYSSVSVRSSANVEDSAAASFAGLFETVLYVDDDEELFDSIKRCYDSVKSPQVRIYSEKRGIDPRKIKMNVIVQGMIDADKSGVIFTKDANTNDSMVIETVNGICNNAVAGLITPSKYFIERRTSKIIEKNIRRNHELTEKELEELINYANSIENHFAKPQDIEWVIEKDQIYILQARPITD